MRVEEQYSDVLFNIETAIISIYDDDPDLLDLEVLDAIDALIRAYTCEEGGRDAPRPRLSDRALDVFELSQHVCEWQLGRRPLDPDEREGEKPEPHELTVPEILRCLKRIRSSVRLWNRQSGRQGYLDYVRQFLSEAEDGIEF